MDSENLNAAQQAVAGAASEIAEQAANIAHKAAEIAAEASHSGEGMSLTHRMTFLVLQVAVIIFAAKVGGGIMKRLKMPSVLGELLTGIVIGPYLLGGISLDFLHLPNGLFPIGADGFPVSPELYGLSTFASIILLFMAGLETDLRQFLKYSVAGTVIGIGGVAVSFIAGDAAGVYWGIGDDLGFLSPSCLFLGALCTATSVGITARILSEKKKMDSPEGVTILAAAIIDDVLGIIGLAIIISLIGILSTGGDGALPWGEIGMIAFRTISVCVVFTVLGLVFANTISRFLKTFKSPTVFATLALGMSFLVAGFFEMSGLAMIIGAYVMGLSLSKTDITLVLQDRLLGSYEFFAPVFFAVKGMLVDVNRILDPKVLKFGIIFGILAVIAKIIGCAFPALFLKFNMKGALRIGAGMVPRGEVALIIAGIGMSSNILDPDMFGGAIIMTLLTTMLAPPIFSMTLSIPGKGVTYEKKSEDYREVRYPFTAPVVADAAMNNILTAFQSEGFFCSMMDQTNRLYSIRKDDIAFSMWREGDDVTFSANRTDINLIGTVVYEALIELHQSLERLREMAKPKEYRRTLASVTSVRTMSIREKKEILTPDTVVMQLTARDKEGAIRELVEALSASRGNEIHDINVVLDSILEREAVASTELEYGVSMPHGRTDEVSSVMAAVGLCPCGLEFNCLDGTPAKLIILVVSPKNTSGPYLQFLSNVTASLRTQEMVDHIVEAVTPEEVVQLLLNPNAGDAPLMRLFKK